MTDSDTQIGRREALQKGALATGALLGGGTALTGTAAAGIGAGRVAHYPMNDIRPDGTVHDASPSDSDGRNHGASVLRGDGVVGSAFDFDGDAYVEVPRFEWSGGPVTVAFWNYVEETDVQRSSAFGWGSQRGPADRFQVHAPWSDETLYWDYGNFRENGRISTDYADYLGAWTHVAVVSEGQRGGRQEIYLNGREAASKDESGGPDTATKPFDIGRWAYGYHRGQIDEFRIHDRVLSRSEIRSLAATGGNGRDP